jgi:RimJ/RimL family protein N-acetyltransferase
MLFCKPPGRNIFYRSGEGISFRTLHLWQDTDTLYRWVNLSYAAFWDMAGGPEEIPGYYRPYLKAPDTHAIIGMYRSHRVCLIDLYQVVTSELGKWLTVNENDCGMHLLMAPPGERPTGITDRVMRSFISWYFSFPRSGCLYAEPDIHNHQACRVLERSGFRFIRNIVLPDKAASLYRIDGIQEGVFS